MAVKKKKTEKDDEISVKDVDYLKELIKDKQEELSEDFLETKEDDSFLEKMKSKEEQEIIDKRENSVLLKSLKEKNIEDESVIEDESKIVEEESVIEEVKDIRTNKLKISNIIIIATLIVATLYYIFYVIGALSKVNYAISIFNATMLLISLILFSGAFILKYKIKDYLIIATSVSLSIFMGINVIASANIIKFPTLAVLKNYANASLVSIIKDTKKYNIKLNQVYEYSDNVKEGYIISQNVNPDTILKNIKEITIVISNGPNYDKELMLTNMVGLNVDEVIKFVSKNFLNNVKFNFEVNNEKAKDLVISQSTKGQIKRNSEVIFQVSLGSLESLADVNMTDLTNKSEFDATLYLKRNGIKYELKYEYNTNIKKDYVISQSHPKGTVVKPNVDTVVITMSLGKEIKVPDFSNKKADDVINWIINNNLKVAFQEKNHVSIPKDELIGINYETGSSISEGTKIIITTSLGPIVVPKFGSLADLRAWCDGVGVGLDETYEYSTNVGKGSIIKTSLNPGDKIDPTTTRITVFISQGSPITVPYFVGLSRSSIQTQCRNLGLNCTFYYLGFNNASRDLALRQNVGSGVKVVSGTYINIGLSSGPAASYNVFIQAEWIIPGNADGTINLLRSKLGAAAPGVTFNFVKKPHNTGFPGQIHPSSPIQATGVNTFVQGNTYTIFIIGD
ncbi:MAG: PASTA domain-containing protein [Bacilli bacterium]